MSERFLPLFPKAHLEQLRTLWDLLLELTRERGALLLRALRLQQYLQECADTLEWIGDKVGTAQDTEDFPFASQAPRGR